MSWVSASRLQYFLSKIYGIFDTKVDKVTGKDLSTNDYTDAEKTKLSGIETGANNYSHPAHTAQSSGLYKVTVDALGHVSDAAAVQKSDITALGIPGQDTTYSDMTGATSSSAGAHGLVPAPASGATDYLLKGDGTWGDFSEMTAAQVAQICV